MVASFSEKYQNKTCDLAQGCKCFTSDYKYSPQGHETDKGREKKEGMSGSTWESSNGQLSATLAYFNDNDNNDDKENTWNDISHT